MAPLDRLTSLDASFLALESPLTPMHVGSLALFEGGPFHDPSGRFRLDELRVLVDERLDLVPRFRRRPVAAPRGLGRPVWVDDPDFDVAHHVKVVSLPPPGTRAQLFELCQHLHMELLDRSRPLWELWLVDGLDDGSVAMIEKVHHAVIDGVSGVDVATALMDASAEVRHLARPEWRPVSGPGLADFARARAENVAGRLGDLAAAGVRALRDPAATLRIAGRVSRLAGTLLTRDTVAPRSSLNRPVGGRHRLLDTVSLPLADAKAVGAAAGATVNDVILATVAGGLRRLLAGRGEEIDPAREMQVMVPVSLRSGAEHLALGNRVSSVFARLPVGDADGLSRLRKVHDMMRDRKQREQARAMAAVLSVADVLPVPVADAVTRTVHSQPFVNLVVTNVPGPPVPLYVMGARMLEAIPIVPLARNLDVSVGILSYQGRLAIGLFADAATCPDVHVLAEGIEESFQGLVHAVVGPAEGRRSA